MRAPLHIELALAMVLAPALCCCKVGLFRPAVGAAPARATDTEVPPPQPAAPKCAHCCQDAPPAPVPAPHPEHQPPHPAAPDSCVCCVARPDAAKPEREPTVPAPEPTGDPLPFARLVPVAPDHFGRARALPAPGRTGVDARYAALFERHVLRC